MIRISLTCILMCFFEYKRGEISRVHVIVHDLGFIHGRAAYMGTHTHYVCNKGNKLGNCSRNLNPMLQLLTSSLMKISWVGGEIIN